MPREHNTRLGRYLSRRLSAKINFITVGGLCLMLLLPSLILTGYFVSAIVDNAKARGGTLADLYSQMCILPLTMNDYATLETSTRSLLLQDEVLFAMAFDDKGVVATPFGHSSRKTSWKPAEFERMVVDRTGREVGRVRVGIRLDKAYKKALQTSMVLLSMVLGVMILTALALSTLLRHYVNRPIRLLRDSVRRVSSGRLDQPVPVLSGDEIGDLAQSFNHMIRRLSQVRNEERQAISRLNDEVAQRRIAENALAEMNMSLESMVRERTSELRSQAAKLEVANLRLRELDRMKSDFLSSVSHELRTPLTSVLGFAKLIARDLDRVMKQMNGLPAKTRDRTRRMGDNLRIIIEESQRLTAMINDVLDLSRIESGRVQWRSTRLDPAHLARRAAQAAEGMFAHLPDVKLEMDFATDLPRIEADPDRLHQVLINLLDNAAKFTRKGRVLMSVESPDEKTVRFSVSDTGEGIAKDQLAGIFDKFQQAADDDLVQIKPKGTGLGLAISRQIVEHHGGSITVESNQGRGSTFSFDIPAARHEE